MNARRVLCALAFTVATLGVAPSALAERVLVLAPVGDGTPESRAAVVGALRQALDTLSFDAVVEPEVPGGAEPGVAPETANDFRALGELHACEFVLEPRVAFAEGGYTLTLRVGYAPRSGLESVVAQVRLARERARLLELLRVVLRPEGSAGEAARFAEPDAEAAGLEAEAAALERARAAEAEEQARLAALAAEAEAARAAEEARAAAAREEEEARAREELLGREATRAREAEAARWAGRERYGTPGRNMVLGGIGMFGVLNATPGAYGGMLVTLEGRYGRSFEAVPGLEARAGLDLVFGSSGGFSLTGGAVYLASPWADAKVHVGGGLELGYHQALTGNRAAQFLLRPQGIVSWHVTDAIWLEGVVPVLTVLSANGGIVTMGVELRAGTRF